MSHFIVKEAMGKGLVLEHSRENVNCVQVLGIFEGFLKLYEILVIVHCHSYRYPWYWDFVIQSVEEVEAAHLLWEFLTTHEQLFDNVQRLEGETQ